MENENAPPACLTYLLILLGIALAVGAALLLSRLDSLQQRALIPQAPLPVVDFEATLAAGDLNVVVITGESSQSELPTVTASATPTVIPMSTGQENVDLTPESPFTPDLVPTCSGIPEGWMPYKVEEGDSLRSLSIQSKISEDTLAQANCLLQPNLKRGQIIYLPIPSESSTKSPAAGDHDP